MKKGTLSIIPRLVFLLKGFLPVLTLTVLFGLLGFLSAQAITFFAALAIVKHLGHDIILTLTAIFSLMITCGVLRGVFRYLEHYTGHYTAFKLLAVLRDKIFKKLRELSPAKLECKEKGNLISMITSDIETLEVFYAHTIAPVTIYILHTAIMVSSISIVSSIWLGLLSLLTYALIGLVIPLVFGRRVKENGRNYRNKYSLLASFFVDGIYGISDLLSFGKVKKQSEKAEKMSLETEQSNKQLKYSSARSKAITDLFVLFGSVAFILFAAFLNARNGLSDASMLLVFVMFVASLGPSLALSALPSSLNQTLVAGERVLNLLDEMPNVTDKTDGIDIEYNFCELKGLSFSYDTKNVLKNLNVRFEKNKIYGICGSSGSGKSTLLKLLMRFYKASEGDILFNNESIKNINTTSLRGNISYMTQDTHIFDMSIYENVSLLGDYSNTEIENACQNANLAELIGSLESGGSTQSGELGARLSSGEKQRIGLARAFLHGGALILLDEPTSNIDALSEAEILKSIKNRSKDKTVILVSHRESALLICDEIYLMSSGTLTQKMHN
ncbi:MAG: ABC transporter ATP-binding protein/permease [Christensenellaceae bacterium]|jgi:ATP-binding cassette subfamily C protein|nr:ABC transporter ATP-binding protein/permease [Christensenellaceae bacterium]